MKFTAKFASNFPFSHVISIVGAACLSLFCTSKKKNSTTHILLHQIPAFLSQYFSALGVVLKMFILPLNTSIALMCTAVSFSFEVLRIFLAWLLARPSDEVRQLTLQKVDKPSTQALLWTFPFSTSPSPTILLLFCRRKQKQN